jgi:enoyl-CoA hydratase/carnithine racemase
MADDTFVTIERGLGPDGRVALVRFDRGDTVNALSPAAMRQLRAAAHSFEDDLETSVVVLTGTARAFSAGFDLKDRERAAVADDGLSALRRSISAGPRMCRAWYGMEQVTIAAIEGFCIGGGAALAVSLDFRVAARGAHFRIPEVALGMNMSWGSIPRMLQLMGPARTKQAVMLASERIPAEEAYDWGLVEHLAEDGSALMAAMALAGRIAAEPPLPVKMTKMTVNRLSGALDDLASHMDLDQFVLTTKSEDSQEGIAAFLERRPARFRGR